MSGHNKWSQIKRQKGVSDAKKSKMFSKFGRLLVIEAKKAGGNLSSPSLKAVIDRAKAANMPNDTIDRALKKASTDKSAAMDSITYESYGPGGCAIIIEALTDNRNKAAQEIKFILSKYGASLAGIGAATWAFKKVGTGWEAQTTVPLEDADIATLEKLVDELEENDEVQEVFTNAE
ncbi:MAG: YebC/PmpR family DNA-binding transcriptional regulator [Candidatus Pacebacteria bacterium]|nr:YebC/PmpR family DNA-binding transcriptional regulator [Candidatus Paceibacterota bacterium]